MFMRINGEEIPSGTGQWKDVINPATGEIVDRIPDGNAEDVGHAVESAGSAFGRWSGKAMRERGVLLFKAASLIREHHPALAELLTREQGKPLREAVDEVRGFCNILEFYAGLSSQPSGEAIHLGNAGDCITRNEPLGVCGAVIPWNMPVLIMGWKIGPALTAGNSMVLKPSSTAPLTVLSIGAFLEKAGIPGGVLNIVTGGGDTAGEALVSHPSVQKISFTGSCATGCRVREIASQQSKELVLELGGSDPMIVMDDADLNAAVEGAIRGRFYNAGQTCTAVKRLFVHEKVAESFIRRLKDRVDSLKVGNGLQDGVEMGPLNNRQQFDAISGIVREAKDLGSCRVLSGGKRLTGPGFDSGYFFAPTLVTDVDRDSRLLSEEVFGPVLPVVTFPDLDTAISDANRSEYGLGASVWTGNIATVRRVFEDVNAGVVWANRHLTLPPEIPFGGVKGSGFGRENGYKALEGYTRTRSLFIGM